KLNRFRLRKLWKFRTRRRDSRSHAGRAPIIWFLDGGGDQSLTDGLFPSQLASATIKPAGVENSQGIIASAWLKDPTDPQWKDDPDIKAWNAFLDKYYPEANRSDANVIYGYAVAQAAVNVLKQCGDNLTRENIIKQAASLRDYAVAGLLPG